VHAATSGGFIDNTLHDFPMRTIYDNLTDAGEEWTVFFHDLPQCIVLQSLRNPAYKKNFKTFMPFFELACKSGTLPSYSFIEPRFFDFLGLKANDQHPPHDVSLGEHLIADVYDTLRNSPAWPHTLLVVTYDEHGGLYDHVLPPASSSPDGLSSADPVFDFRRLGLRVPTIIVSPFTAKGVLDHAVYDHSSVPATLKELFDLPTFLTARDRDANTFAQHVTNTMRTDTPTHLPRPPRPLGAPMAVPTGSVMDDDIVLSSLDQASHEPLSEFQQSLIDASKGLDLPETPRERVARLAQIAHDEHDGAVIVRAAFERYVKASVAPAAAVPAPRPHRAAPLFDAAPGGSGVDEVRSCIDRRAAPSKQTERMALVKDSTWAPGQILRVRFLDGDPALQTRVQQWAEEWMKHANIQLAFGDAPDASIRVSFQRRGSWSFIGRECLNIAPSDPTMNYGWLKLDTPDDEVSRVVLHEFGHALGCIHEHNHPLGGIHWKKDAVYAYYAGPPNFWTKEQVDTNLFALYDKNLTVFSALDPQSIMMYPIDPSFTEDGFSVGMNRTLSATDVAFIKQLYPF
jgi:serralysin